MNSISRTYVLFALVWATVFAQPLSADVWELYFKLVQRGQLELRLPEGALADHCRRAARRLQANSGLELVLLDPDARGDESRPRLVLGSLEDPAVEELAHRLGVSRIEEGGFRYGGHSYSREGDALVAWFEDPRRPGLPVALYLSERPRDLIPIINDFSPASLPSVIGYHRGDVVFDAELAADGSLKQQSVVDNWVPWMLYRESASETKGSGLHAHVPEEVDAIRLEDYLRRMRRSRTRAVTWMGLGKSAPILRLYFHAHLEDLTRLTRSSDLSVRNDHRPGAHVLLAAGVPDDGGAAAIEALVRRELGPPADAWLAEGVGVAAAGSWWGRPLEQQLGRLASAGIVPPLSDLIDPSAVTSLSSHLRAPLRALLFQLALAEAGPQRAMELWKGEQTLAIDDSLEAAFASRLERASEAFDARPKTSISSGFKAGFVLESEKLSGAYPANSLLGYASRGSDQVLEQVHSLGANAVALSASAFIKNEWPVRPDAPMTSRRRATESDAAIASASGAAKALSMEVLLQPHLLTSATGIYAGRQAWSGPHSLERLLDEYERFVVHYALLADLLGCEVLCLGTELDSAMDFEPDPLRKQVNYDLLESKRARWISIIDRARACFDGALTYSVRSSHEAKSCAQFELWNHFDFVSASLFQKTQGPSWKRQNDLEEIESQIRALSRAAGSVDLPLLILSVGFPSSHRAAFDPGTPGNTLDGVFVERQAALYEVLAQVVDDARERGKLGGAFVWSISTNPLRRGTADAGYTPLGKPAGEWLPLFFGR